VQNIYQKPFFWICLLVLCIAWHSPVSGKSDTSFDAKSKATIKKAALKKDLLIMPQLNKLNFGFGRHKGIEYFYEKTISKIFFQERKLEARVIDVIIEGPNITLELSHSILGPGTIKFFFSDELLEQTTDEGILMILLETLGDENHQYVVLDPQSKLYHLWSCNHSSDPNLSARMRREDAETQGYRASGFCFKKMLYIPQFLVEKALERDWAIRLRNYEPIENGSKKRALLTDMGKKVLQNWPLKRVGYDYAFYLSDSRRIDAFAMPTGKIIITTALFDSLANENELEALLVYAIAHIEQRHSLKEYYSCLQDEKYANVMKKLAELAGSLAGPASGVISGALNAALPETSCNPQSLGGYQNVYVQEADSMASLYFEAHGKDKRAIISLIKKLQFSDLSEKLHPDQRLTGANEDYYYERLKRVKNTRFMYFGNDKNFVLKRKGKPPVQLDLIGQRFYKKENTLLAYIDEKNLLQLNQDANGKLITKLLVKDKDGNHLFKLNDQFLTEDVWGAYLTFEASSPQKQNVLQEIEKVVLSLVPARGPADRESSEPGDKLIKVASDVLNDQTGTKYVFVPGTIEW
jgi:hypothetical protein